MFVPVNKYQQAPFLHTLQSRVHSTVRPLALQTQGFAYMWDARRGIICGDTGFQWIMRFFFFFMTLLWVDLQLRKRGWLELGHGGRPVALDVDSFDFVVVFLRDGSEQLGANVRNVTMRRCRRAGGVVQSIVHHSPPECGMMDWPDGTNLQN